MDALMFERPSISFRPLSPRRADGFGPRWRRPWPLLCCETAFQSSRYVQSCRFSSAKRKAPESCCSRGFSASPADARVAAFLPRRRPLSAGSKRKTSDFEKLRVSTHHPLPVAAEIVRDVRSLTSGLSKMSWGLGRLLTSWFSDVSGLCG